MKKKNLLHDTKFQAAILAAVAIVFLILVFVAGESMMLMAIWIALCASAFIISCILFIDGLRGGAVHTNYFLIDRRTNKSVAVDALNFELANNNLTYLISQFNTHPVDLWNGFPRSLLERLKQEPMLRTPVVFRMLYELSLLPGDEILERFQYADKDAVRQVCRFLSAGGDEEMAQIIMNMNQDIENEKTHIVAFFTKNKRFFEGRIVTYIKRHINDYAVVK